jgi:hypothetical protein
MGAQHIAKVQYDWDIVKYCRYGTIVHHGGTAHSKETVLGHCTIL